MKIDRGFVKELPPIFLMPPLSDPSPTCAMMWAGRYVWRGVETEEEYEAVRELGMEYIQGYYFGRPMSARQFEDRLKGIGRTHRLSISISPSSFMRFSSLVMALRSMER